MQPGILLLIPFVALLAAIALAPLFCPAWWKRHFAKVSLSLALVTLALYFGGHHPVHRVVETGVEYISFISLIGSLFIISSGIHINVAGRATPAANVVFLLIGAMAANVLGTTGASMLLIRPWLRLNKNRLAAHHIVFFIFIVSNVGGSLTPIGDPPLFLGYLQGVPFWWMATHCWTIWATGIGILLTMFFVVDRRHGNGVQMGKEEMVPSEWRVQGLHNVFFLAVVLIATFIKQPPFLREGLMIGAAAGSYFSTKKAVHLSNDFNFEPIEEVAILFAGIFATMIPALDWLQAQASQSSQLSPSILYWGCGTLSSALDNAPTYLAFLSADHAALLPADAAAAIVQQIHDHGSNVAAMSGPPVHQLSKIVTIVQMQFPMEFAQRNVTADQVRMALALQSSTGIASLKAISIAAVFFGACTYIGNGPNFLVKAIAEQQGIKMPTFLGYIGKYALPFMAPMLVVVWWLYFS